MGSPIIWKGAGAQILKDKVSFSNEVSVTAGNLNPTVTAVDAKGGSIYLSSLTSAVYVKQDSGSSTNWALLDDASNEIPSGGTTGQALVKTSDDNYDVEWATVAGGSGIDELTGDVVAGPGSGSQVASIPTSVISTYGRTLVDDADATAARATLELEALATVSNLTGDVTSVGAATTLGANYKIMSVGITIDGGGSTITTGSKGYITIPYDCTVTGWTLIADQSGSIVIDVKSASYAGFPTTASIAGSELPTLSAAQKNQDNTLTTWTSAVTAGNIWEFVVNSATTVTRVNLTCKVVRT